MKTRTHHRWDDEQEQILARVYPAAKWDVILTALPGMTKTAIYQRARNLGILRWAQGSSPVGQALFGTCSEADIGWLAGYIDGEGTLQLRLSKRSSSSENHDELYGHYYSPMVRIVNTSQDATMKAQRIMGGGVRLSRPGLWMNYLSGIAQMQKLLRILLPHLEIKKQRALLLLKYAEIRQAKGTRAHYGEEEDNLYREFYEGIGKVGTRPRRHLIAYRIPDNYANAELSEGDL